MKDLGIFLGYALATAAVIALLIAVGTAETLPTWVLPLVALLSVIVIPVALGVVLARRGKQRAGNNLK